MNKTNTQDFVLPVEGMSCAGCAAGLQGTLEKLEGVIDVNVNFALSNANISVATDKQSRQNLISAIETAGYEVPVEKTPITLQTARFSVEGMSCAGCSSGLEKKLQALDGVRTASVNFALTSAELEFDPQLIDMQSIQQNVIDAGYQIPYLSHTLSIGGMSCAGCAVAIEKRVREQHGVLRADVNLALEKIEVQTLANISPQELISTITKAGFSASIPQTVGITHDADVELDSWRIRLNHHGLLLSVGVLLSLPMVIQMFVMVLGGSAFLPGWIEFALATPVQFWVGWRFYQGAYRALRSGNGNMDLLVVMGTSAAYLFSLYLLLTASSSHLYFESSAVVITLVMLGKWLEVRAKKSATAAIRELMALRPQSARRLINGVEQEVSIPQLVLGDIVVVKPGETIPVDGVVQNGVGEVDESLISGESMPVGKVVGDQLTGGSINGNGLLHVEVNALGSDTTLSRIIDIVEKAQSGKAPVQRLVDKISAVFVPVVIVLALLTFLGWILSGAPFEHAIIAAVSVLVIACPCALGLATPTALVAGTGVAAKAGILIKDIATLENASKIKRVVFDKTGTLTQGKPQVTDYITFSSDTSELNYAASLQSGSEHPLANALCQYATQQGVSLYPIDTFENLPGNGVIGRVGDRDIAIGNQALVAKQTDNSHEFQAQFDHLEKQGKTAVGIVLDNELLAIVGFADQLRPESIEGIKALKSRGILTTILSGDSQTVTKTVAEQLGIDSYKAGLAPEHKAAIVASYTTNAEPVAMVGDGVNDAPALAVADVGIAMGSGTDVAIASSSFTLLRPDPRLVAAALDIATATRSKIHQNLFWAFVYNIIGIPLAAFGLLTPSVAGAAMAMSSVSVVSNALLLKRWKPTLGNTDADSK